MDQCNCRMMWRQRRLLSKNSHHQWIKKPRTFFDIYGFQYEPWFAMLSSISDLATFAWLKAKMYKIEVLKGNHERLWTTPWQCLNSYTKCQKSIRNFQMHVKPQYISKFNTVEYCLLEVGSVVSDWVIFMLEMQNKHSYKEPCSILVSLWKHPDLCNRMKELNHDQLLRRGKNNVIASNFRLKLHYKLANQ